MGGASAVRVPAATYLLVPYLIVMATSIKQWAAGKFCYLLSTNAAETVFILQTANKDMDKGKSQVYRWFSRF